MKLIISLFRVLYGKAYFYLAGSVANARRLGVKVGCDCRIYVRSFGSEPFLISIGDRVTVTGGVRFLTHDGSTILVRDANGRRYQYYAPIKIGDDVFIGIDSILLPGVTVGSRVVIAAGSVVTRDIPDDSVVGGVPARQLQSFEEYSAKVRARCVSESVLSRDLPYKDRVAEAILLANECRGASEVGVES